MENIPQIIRPNAQEHAEFSIISKSSGHLTKTISFVGGALVKDATQCWLSRGTVRRTHVDGLDGLAATLARLNSNQAITLGIVQTSTAGVEFGLSSRKNASVGQFTRTKDFFSMPSGQCFALLDYDPSKGGVAMGLLELKEKLLSIIPELRGVGLLLLGSTSSGIITPDGTTTIVGGIHIYIQMRGGELLEPLFDLLHIRTWLAGRFYMGW